MTVQNLLSRLDKVKKTGTDKWIACCPSHRGTKQSLAIRDDNGKVLVHCFAEGCGILDILGAVGLDMNDVQPKLNGEYKSNKKPFYSGDILQISHDEMLVAFLICKKMLNNTLNFNDMERLKTCVARLGHAVDLATGDNGVGVSEKWKQTRVNQKLVEAELHAN